MLSFNWAANKNDAIQNLAQRRRYMLPQAWLKAIFNRTSLFSIFYCETAEKVCQSQFTQTSLSVPAVLK